MKLYLLAITTDIFNGDVSSVVVRAQSEKEARNIVSEDLDNDYWVTKKHSTCTELPSNGRSEVITRIVSTLDY